MVTAKKALSQAAAVPIFEKPEGQTVVLGGPRENPAHAQPQWPPPRNAARCARAKVQCARRNVDAIERTCARV
jgi:hypothetical protein